MSTALAAFFFAPQHTNGIHKIHKSVEKSIRKTQQEMVEKEDRCSDFYDTTTSPRPGRWDLVHLYLLLCMSLLAHRSEAYSLISIFLSLSRAPLVTIPHSRLPLVSKLRDTSKHEPHHHSRQSLTK